LSTDPAVFQREFLVSLWKIAILAQAVERPVVGLWVMRDLRSRGYDVSPGTIYPMLRRMAEYGWLAPQGEGPAHAHARCEYRITDEGRKALGELRDEVARLHEALSE